VPSAPGPAGDIAKVVVDRDVFRRCHAAVFDEGNENSLVARAMEYHQPIRRTLFASLQTAVGAQQFGAPVPAKLEEVSAGIGGNDMVAPSLPF